MPEMDRHLAGWLGHAMRGNTHALRRSLLAKPLPRRPRIRPPLRPQPHGRPHGVAPAVPAIMPAPAVPAATPDRGHA